jgi:hypothetical protein
MEIPAKPVSYDERGDLPEDVLGFTDGGMTLVMRLIDKKVPAETQAKIFDFLMEPDMDAHDPHYQAQPHAGHGGKLE